MADAAPIAPIAGNFSAHLAAVDAAPGGDPGGIPDRPVQVQDDSQPSEPFRRYAGAETAPEMPTEVDPNAPPEGEEPLEQPPEGEPLDELEQLREFKRKVDSDEWDDALLNKVRKVKINGQDHYITANEAFSGYMRNSDYSRKMREVTEVKNHAESIRQGANVLMEHLKSPKQLLEASKELGFYDSLFQVARHIAKQRYQLSQLDPQTRRFAEALEQTREQHAREARERARLERELETTRRPPEVDQREQVMKHQLSQLVPRAFAKFKIGDYPLARELFGQNLESLYQGGEIDAALVEQAAQATVENLGEIAQRLPNGRPQNGNGHQLSPRAAAPSNGKPAVRRTGGNSEDFRAHLARLGSR